MPFPTTRWSLLVAATLHGDERQAEALAEFCRRYREPVLGVIRRRVDGAAAAEDLVQEFFLHLLQHSTLRRANPTRGRFRSFLLGSLERFLTRERLHAAAAKRGGGRWPLSLDALPDGAGVPSVPAAEAAAFDREWAADLLTRVRSGLREDWRDRSAEFEVLARFLPGTAGQPAYADAAAELGWKETRLKTEVHRLRRDFRARVRAEVGLTVDAPHEVDEEMAHLLRALGGQPH